MQRAASALLGITLALCPPNFRNEYGAAIRADFARALGEVRAVRGALAASRYALVAIFDLMSTAFVEYAILLLRDFNYAVRTLRRTVLFTTIIVATLAIAIGANVAVFSIVNAVVLAPLPYPAPSALVAIRWYNADDPRAPSSLPDYADIMRHSAGIFASSAAFQTAAFTLTGNGFPRRADAVETTADLFRTLGIHPELGRVPAEVETHQGAARPVVLSAAFWRGAFNADPRIVGSIVRLDGEPYHVLGVANLEQPDVDRGFAKADLWTFVPQDGRGTRFNRKYHSFEVIARLAPGVSLGRADAAVRDGVRDLRRLHPDEDAQLGSRVIPLTDSLVGGKRDLFFGIFAAVGAVLLIACANVANLLLSRAVSREREFSVRVAVGASRGRVVTQLLVEAFLLAAIGAAIGVGVAYGVLAAFVVLHPENIPRADHIAIDGAAFVFTIGIVAFCTLASGLLPAITASRRDVAAALTSAGRGGDSQRGARARDAFVACEIALTLALVIAAGLVLRSFVALTGQALGFDPSGIVTVGQINFTDRRYATGATRDAFEQRALAIVRAVGGVRNAAWSDDPPFTDMNIATTTSVVGRAYRRGLAPTANIGAIGVDYFQVVHATLLAGRPFLHDDRMRTLPVAIVNESFARTYFPGGSAIGARIKPEVSLSKDQPAEARTIVGVVANMRTSFLRAVSPTVYVPVRQLPMSFASLVIDAAPGTHPGPAVATALATLDPLLPKPEVTEIATSFSRDVAAQRLSMAALSALAIVALILAAAGIFAVVSFGVSQRTHEFGIRMALGASGWRILGNVLLGVLRLVAVGIVLGLVLSVFCTRFLGTQLYATAPLDPVTFASVTALIVFTAVIAALVPARRATCVEPIVALRYE